jgi:hypothetical protein
MLLFLSIFSTALVLKLNWLFTGVPGADLLGSDIPKSLMLLNGQNPYSTMPYASPYPPFLLFVDALIIRVTGGTSLGVIAWNIRVAGMLAELGTGVLIFLTLRARRVAFTGMLLSTIVFFLDPSISSLNYFFFHSDVFGILILAISLFVLTKNRIGIGLALLGFATIFKVHPILSIFLIAVWLVRRDGFYKSIPRMLPVGALLVSGLLLPFRIPGYSRSFLGFNLQNGDDGKASFTLLNLFYGVLPHFWNVSVSNTLVNYVWVASTVSLIVVGLGFVWSRARSIGPVEVVLVGLLVWLLPLRELHPMYLVWMLVPLLMLGRTGLTVLVVGLFDVASVLAHWAWNIPPNPFPVMNSPIGFFAASLVFAGCSSVASLAVLRMGHSEDGTILPSLRPGFESSD